MPERLVDFEPVVLAPSVEQRQRQCLACREAVAKRRGRA